LISGAEALKKTFLEAPEDIQNQYDLDELAVNGLVDDFKEVKLPLIMSYVLCPDACYNYACICDIGPTTCCRCDY